MSALRFLVNCVPCAHCNGVQFHQVPAICAGRPDLDEDFIRCNTCGACAPMSMWNKRSGAGLPGSLVGVGAEHL